MPGCGRLAGAWSGRCCSAITGVGALVSAPFPLYDDAAGVTQIPPGHLLGGLTFFLVSPLALIALSDPDAPRSSLAIVGRLHPRLRVWSWSSLDVITLGFVLPDDAALHDWAGLAQRSTQAYVTYEATGKKKKKKKKKTNCHWSPTLTSTS